ncbi:MAG: Na/Pi cotransporter family protein [Sphaerochaetaceae bacterium]|nr:Na/Pi cotransporter family protein [Sphaerochaetaceae bacterium]
MDFFDVLTMLGGLCLFLFGMSLMGQSLERRAGNSLKTLLGRLTNNKVAGLLTGLGVTAIIQSSSATTVMVVGFVNSGLMTLKQSINVIMGANIGTTVTAWILSLAGIDSSNAFISLLKPSSFTPVLALVGIFFYMMGKDSKKKDTGMILLGFTTLMFGMETMSGAVSGLRDVPEFKQLFLAFTNPVLGVIAGAALTALIQSSSASVGILQSLASTGAVTYGAAIPILIGQHIGTCVTAMLSSIGANTNARRAALVHLSFNIIGGTVWITLFCIIKAFFAPSLLSESATLVGIAVSHSIISLATTLLLFPFSNGLEKLVCRLIPETSHAEEKKELDERLLGSPALALNQCKHVLNNMAVAATEALKQSLDMIEHYDEKKAGEIRKAEDVTDHLEDVISTYLLKLTSTHLGDEESVKATEYMKIVGDYERIGDHAVNILASAEELREKEITFTEQAMDEYRKISCAVSEILDLSYQAFSNKDYDAAKKTEPLEQEIDALKEILRTRHILRLQRGECTVSAGFVWSDLLTNIERVSDHCSNISGCVLDTTDNTMNIHQNQRIYKASDKEFKRIYKEFEDKYRV